MSFKFRIARKEKTKKRFTFFFDILFNFHYASYDPLKALLRAYI